MQEAIHQWADGFLNSQTEEMSESLANLFVKLNLGIPPSTPPSDIIRHAQGDFFTAVLAGRVEALQLDLTGQVFALICVLSVSPGELVMWATALRSWQLRNGGQQISMDLISVKLFPKGFPTKRALSDAWDAQKTSNKTNLLDACASSGIFRNKEEANVPAGQNT